MNYFLLYLILRLDALSNAVIGLSIITGIFLVIAIIIFTSDSNKESRDSAKICVKRFGISFAIAILFTIMIPSTQQAAVIYCLPKVVNNEQIQGIPDKLLKLSDAWLDEKIWEATEPIKEIMEN